MGPWYGVWVPWYDVWVRRFKFRTSTLEGSDSDDTGLSKVYQDEIFLFKITSSPSSRGEPLTPIFSNRDIKRSIVSIFARNPVEVPGLRPKFESRTL